MALSAAMLSYTSIQKAPSPWLVVSLGGAPLIVFHWLILTPKGRDGLNSAEIDSVYYFGFLVTLGALGVGAISANPGEPNATTRILSHFGVGLAATGYAVVARLHLTSIGLRGELDSMEDALSRQMQGSQALLDQMTLIVANAAQLSAGIQQARDELVRQASTGWQDLNKQIVGAVTDQVGSLLSNINTLTNQTIDSVGNLRSTVDGSLVSEIGRLSSALAQLSSESQGFASTLSQATKSAANDEVALKSLNDTLIGVTTNFRGLESVSSAMANLTDTTNTAAGAVTHIAGELTASSQALANAATEIGQAPRAFRKLSTVVERVLQVLEATSVVIERIREQSNELVQTGDRLVGLGSASIELDVKLRSASSAMAAVEQELVKISPAATSAHGALSALARSETVISQTGTSLERILGDLQGSPVLVDSLKKLDGLAERLGQSSDGLTRTIDGLSGRLGSANGALERDAVRSAELIVQLEQRLIRLVETIIAQTSRRQEITS